MKNKILFAALFISCVLFCCKKDSEKGSPEAPFGIEMIFSTGGTVIIREGTAGGVNSYGRAGGLINTAGNYFEIQSTAFSGNGAKLTIYFMKKFPAQPDSSVIESIFHTGNYPFGGSVIDSLKDGAETIFDAANGTRWSSAYGFQSGSFSVTEHVPNDFDNFTPFMTSGTFSCTLYDTAGNTLQVNAATFKGRTVVYP